jgi:16S rRNA (cytosine967-C5)-methyltransferase
MTDVFKQGFFEVQDANSQLVSAFLDVNQECVLWILAGCSGKHCTLLLDGKQRTIDCHGLYESKLKQLKIRAKRDGAFNIEYRIIDTTKVIKNYNKKRIVF